MGWTFGLNSDHGMTLAGLALATATACFAYDAIDSNDGVPKLNGAEHMAIFSRPARRQDERVATRRLDAAVEELAANQEATERAIDYAPTASIRGGGAPQSKILRVLPDRVIFEAPWGAREIRPGEKAEGFGRLQEIRLVDGKWTAVIAPEGAKGQSSK